MPVYGQSIGLSAARIGLVLSSYAARAFVVRLLMQSWQGASLKPAC